MTNAIAAIRNIYSLPEVNAVAAFSPAGATTSTPPLNQPAFYNWQTLINPRQAMSSALVGQPQQQPALPAILPQVQAGATTNGASAELNQLLNSTGTLASDVVAQSALLEQAQKQVEQQKALQQQQQVQVNQLKQQNAMLAQQINALQQQQQQTLNPASLTVPLVNGGVASSNPYLVGLGSLGSYGNPSSSLIFPANQLYSPTFSTAGMPLNTANTSGGSALYSPTFSTAGMGLNTTENKQAPISTSTLTASSAVSSTHATSSGSFPPFSATSAMPAQLVYKRQKGSVEGTLQVKDSDGKVIAELPARSGQQEAADTDWETAKSPIPFSPAGEDYYLSLKPLENSAVFAEGNENVGLFFPISSDESQPEIIEQGGKTRTAIGLHSENDKPGSAGCVVVLWDTPERKQQVQALYDKLAELGKTQKTIRFSVVSL